MAVDTRKAKRRELRFETLEAILAEADRLEKISESGPLKPLGNWTLGQTLAHLAFWTNAAFDPIPMRVPWWLRMIMKTQKRKMCYGKMPAGVRLPGVTGGTLGADDVPASEGLSRLRRATARFGKEKTKPDNPAFGPMNEEEWRALMCRHAEHHLGFFEG